MWDSVLSRILLPPPPLPARARHRYSCACVCSGTTTRCARSWVSGWWRFVVLRARVPIVAAQPRVNMVTDEIKWSDIVEPHVSSSASKEEQKRQQLIFELLCTEQSYVQDLQLVVEVFYTPMKAAAWLKPSELETVFMNWQDLITYNLSFLTALQDRQVGGDVVFLAGFSLDACTVFCPMRCQVWYRASAKMPSPPPPNG